MNRDDIIRMAREAGMERVVKLHSDGTRTVELPHPDLLERFAALVASAEREACAALLEANGMRCGEESLSRLILETNASAIRARNNT